MSDQIVDAWVKIAHPIKEQRTDHEFIIDFCNVYEDAHEHVKNFYNHSDDTIDLFHAPKDSGLIPCEAFEHKPHYESIITEFDLYCTRDSRLKKVFMLTTFINNCSNILSSFGGSDSIFPSFWGPLRWNCNNIHDEND